MPPRSASSSSAWFCFCRMAFSRWSVSGSSAGGLSHERERQANDRSLSRLEIRGCRSRGSIVSVGAPKLSIERLQAGYGDVQVLWDVTIEVGTGELVCLIGSNGAGKTTLMRCISGLLAITAGQIVVDGRRMAQPPPADFLRAGIVHVPEGRRLFSAMSVRDNLLMGAYLRDDKDRIAEDLIASMRCFPFLPSGGGRTPARCRAASNRCARSAAG